MKDDMKLTINPSAGQPTLLPDQVADALIGVIFRGEKPGDRIPEEKFAVRLKVSRVPLREAFRQLELLGIVRREPNRGNFVAGASWDKIADIMSVRNVLEGTAVERASLKGLPEDFSRNADESGRDEAVCSAPGADAARPCRHRLSSSSLGGFQEPGPEATIDFFADALFRLYGACGLCGCKGHGRIRDRLHPTLLNLISSHNPNQARGYLMDMNFSYLERLNGLVAHNGS
jgi:DNA-binding transcriptional regulator YhcF (GntR family)